MAKLFIAHKRKEALLVLGLQFIVVLLIAILFLIFKGIKPSYSVLVGGITWLLPSLYFTLRLFANMSPRAVSGILKTFYMGEITKLVLCACLVIVTIIFLPILFGPFLVGFIGALMGLWLAPLLLTRRMTTT